MKPLTPLLAALLLCGCKLVEEPAPQITHFSTTGTDGTRSSHEAAAPINRLENFGRFSLDYRINVDFTRNPDVIIAISKSGDFDDPDNEVLLYINCDEEDPYCHDAALECIFDPAFDLVCGEDTPVEYHVNLARYFERTGLPPNESFLILDTCYNRTVDDSGDVFQIFLYSNDCDRTSTRVVFR